MSVLEAVDVAARFPVRGGGTVHALSGVSLTVEAGEVLGVLGESGCGKSTLARILVRLIEPSAGRVLLDGEDLTALRGRALRAWRRAVQLVFQDPYSSLDPRQSVGAALTEVLTVHRGALPGARSVPALLDEVGLSAAVAARRPHELSGGQRQRVVVARALAVSPRVLVLDEPLSALDVSVRAEVLNLLLTLREQHGLAQVFISHDVSVVRRIADRVLVLYAGRVVETGPHDAVLGAPRHPYTAGLAAAVPVPDPTVSRPRVAVRGEVPDPADLPPGCAFAPRCPAAEPACTEAVPPLVAVGPEHRAACLVAARDGRLPTGAAAR